MTPFPASTLLPPYLGFFRSSFLEKLENYTELHSKYVRTLLSQIGLSCPSILSPLPRLHATAVTCAPRTMLYSHVSGPERLHEIKVVLAFKMFIIKHTDTHTLNFLHHRKYNGGEWGGRKVLSRRKGNSRNVNFCVLTPQFPLPTQDIQPSGLVKRILGKIKMAKETVQRQKVSTQQLTTGSLHAKT